MSELRSQMIRAMELKDFSDRTQDSYLRVVAGIAKILWKVSRSVESARSRGLSSSPQTKRQKRKHPQRCYLRPSLFIREGVG